MTDHDLEQIARTLARTDSREMILATSDESELHHVSDSGWRDWIPHAKALIAEGHIVASAQEATGPAVAWQWQAPVGGKWHTNEVPDDPEIKKLLEADGYKFRQLGVLAEGRTAPANLPHNWEYQAASDCVVCGGCLFRFGAEHPDGDGKWTCPNCGDGNGESPAGTVSVPIEALRNCRCPADYTMTIGECSDKNVCGCSIALDRRTQPVTSKSEPRG